MRTAAQNSPGSSAKKIHREIQSQFEAEGRDDWPSESTIRRIIKRHKASDHAEREQYGYVYWPESFESGVLPWEAGAVLLPALRLFLDSSKRRPTIRWARWYWRIIRSAPSVSQDLLHTLAGVMAATELTGADSTATLREVEAKLLNPDATQAGIGVSLPAGTDSAQAVAVMRELGLPIDDERAQRLIERVDGLASDRATKDSADGLTSTWAGKLEDFIS